MSEFKNAGLQVQEYVYDFAVDGGSTVAKVLSDKAGFKPLPTNALVKQVHMFVETACVGSSSTIIYGHADDTDGYSGSAIAEATLVINYANNSHSAKGAQLWDDSNDCGLTMPVLDANDGKFVLTIGTAALTAGKLRFLVEYILPGKV